MQKKKLLFLCIVLFVCTLPVSAQILKEVSEEIEGMPLSMYGSNKDILYTSKNECVYAIGDETIVGGTDAVLVKINSDLKVLWKTKKTEGFLCAAKSGNNIIEFSTEDWKRNTAYFIKTIHAKLVSIETGKTVLEKDVYKISDKIYTQPLLHTDAQGNFQFLQVRYTKQDKLLMADSKKEIALQGTTKIDIVTFTENLDTKSEVTLNTNTLNNEAYAGSITNNKGDLFIASDATNNITIEKYENMQANVVSSLKMKVDLPEGARLISILNNGKVDNEILFLMSLYGKDIAQSADAYRFDFTANQVFYDKSKSLPFKQDEDLTMLGIESYKDKIIVLSEKRGFRTLTTTAFAKQKLDEHSHFLYSSGDMHVSLCDSNFTLIKDVVIKKTAEFNFNLGLQSGYKISEDKLFVLSNTMPGPANVEIKYATIDLNDYTLKDGVFENQDAKGFGKAKGWGNFGNIIPAETIWFGSIAITPYAIQRLTLSAAKFNHILQKIEF